MKKLHKTLVYTLLASLFLIFTQCKNKEKAAPQKIDPAFTGYIIAYPPGVISNQSELKIKLAEKVAGINPGEEYKEKLFDFTPNIKGKTYWDDQQTVVFQPEKQLPSGKTFDVEFALHKIMEVPEKLKNFKFQVQTMNQAVQVQMEGLKVYETDDLTRQKLHGVLKTADFADNGKVEEILHATQDGKSLNISWQHNGTSKEHFFVVEEISRGKKQSQVILEWNGKPIDSEDTGDEAVEIPPLGDFSVFDVQVIQQPEQCITVFFGDPIDQNQELQGLIHLKNGARVRLVTRESSVRVYPESRQMETTEIIVEQGVRNIMGYQLKERYTNQVRFTNIKPDVKMIGDGVILPNSNGLIFPFKAVNINGVNVKIIKIFEDNVPQFLQANHFDGKRELRRVGRIVYKKAVPLTSDKNIDYGQWNTFSLDLSEMISAEPGAIYRVHVSFDKSQSLYPCSGDDDEEESQFITSTEDPEIARYDEPYDGYYYYDDNYYSGNYRWNERDNPCKDSYYMRNNHSIVRNVLASDLGIIAKRDNDQTMTVAVTDMINTQSLSGVKVEVYNYQNQLMAQATTDGQGMAKLPLDSKPFLLIAKKDAQRGYLRIDDGSALSLSMFDVGGQKNKKGVKGYIYGERGVWRPGDSIYVTFVLEDKNKTLPANHPVVFELYSPENQLYQQRVKTTAVNGFYDFRTATKQSDPTGNWLAKVKVGGSTFTKYLKIETVKPNRLKINLDFGTDLLKKGENPQGTLEVKWLHGAIARNLKADVNVTLSEGRTTFKEFPGYNFDDQSKSFSSQETELFDGKLDENGKALVSTKFNVGDNAPGMLSAKFRIRAFEKGGDFSTDIMTKKYSPYKSYVGLKIPEGKGWNGALYSNETNLVPIVTVDEDGQPIDRKRLKIEIFKIHWRWWWEHGQDDDLGRYVANRSENLMQTEYVATEDGKAIYEMNLNQRSWGRKYIRVTDPVTGHSTGQLFYTSYKGWWNSDDASGPGGAEMLSFSTNKKKYNVGEKVQVELPASEKGRALVSIESGSKVLETFWVDVDKDNHKFTFEAKPSMAPNVYLHIAYIQPHNQTANDLPIRLYGVQPVMVEDAATHLNPVIEMPDVLEPEQEVTLKISEANGKKMTYTIAVVDEGLLDLTRFATPNAWSQFYAREALGVKTWDMYKYVMGAFSGEMAGLLALGGDEEIQNKGGKKANRFKPVVEFLGPFELKRGSNKHTFVMPNYVGSVRTMVVAGYEGAYGSSEKTTPVKKPLMTIATLPRVMGPTEKVKLPVTVFAMEENIKKVQVKVETNELFTIEGEDKKTIEFNQAGDQTIDFDLVVGQSIGIGKVHIEVSSGREKASYDIELDVRLPNPPVTRVTDAVIDPGKSWKTDYQAVGVKGTNHGVVEISSMPPINLENRLRFLIRYPHGCIEQTTSSVFPQLHLDKILELSDEQKAEIETNIKAGIDRLRKFQLTNGGMSYWPGESGHANDWGTNYAGHFMLEAEAIGYSLPPGFKKDWIRFQTNRANDWSVSKYSSQHHYYNSNQLIQAYRLYTLALAGKPAMGAMNRLREMPGLSLTAKWRLAAAYHLAGREKVAEKMIDNLGIRVKNYQELSFSYGSTTRDEAMILETLILMKKTATAKDVLIELANKLSSDRWYSTQTTAYSLLAIAKFVGVTGEDDKMSYTLGINNQTDNVKTEAVIAQTELPLAASPQGNIVIENKSQKVLFAKIQQTGVPLIGDETDASNDLFVKVRYLDMDGNPMNVSKLAQGTDFIAEVRIEHPGIRTDYKEMALTQIFPSGWEIRNLRMEESSSIHTKDVPRYQDIRDDRVYSYFDVERNASRNFRILLNAAYVGKFYLPTVYCEAMYNNEINAQKAGQWVEVVKME